MTLYAKQLTRYAKIEIVSYTCHRRVKTDHETSLKLNLLLDPLGFLKVGHEARA